MLRINGMTKKYKDFNLDVSMEVRPGCVTGLIGKNGSGKSTTFKCILGVTRKEGGTLELFGKEVDSAGTKEKQRLGVTMAEAGFNNTFNMKDICRILKGLYPNFEEKKFCDLCRDFQIPFDKKIGDFSTGMKAKAKVIIAVTHQADLLVLDEPTLGLDVTARDEVLGLLRRYLEENEERSILISSHISSDLESICDDFYMIDNGKIVFHEETDVLLGEYAVLKVDADQYQTLDKRYITKEKKESFGYSCLTNQKKYYQENYPQIVVEKASIDEFIMFMIGGK